MNPSPSASSAALIIRNPVELPGPKSDGGRYKLPKTVGPQMINRVMPWVEDYYRENKRYPSDSEFLSRYEIDANGLENLQRSRLYRNALRSRGIISEPNLLLPEQIATISVLTNFADGRSQDAKLASLGVSVEQYNGWLNQAEFRRRLEASADEVMTKIYPTAMDSFAKQIKAGNMRAIEKYFEMTGRAQTPEMVNMQKVARAMIEAVQRHVKDPELLKTIAADIDLAMKA